MKNIGVVKTLALGILGLVGYYFLLRKIGEGVSYQFIAVIYGLSAGLYFSGFNMEWIKAVQSDKIEGGSVAAFRIIAILTGIVGPVVGALFITKLSFQILFLFVSIILLLSLLPLIFAGDYKLRSPRFSVRAFVKLGTRRRAFVFFLRGAVDSGIDILWPAFIYLNYRNFLTVGGIISATSLVMTILVYFIGKYSDLNQARAYKVGILSHAPTWLIRLLLLTPGGLFVSNLAGSATGYMVDIPFSKIVLHSQKTSGRPFDYYIWKELFSWLGRIGVLYCAVLTDNLTILFGLISVAVTAHLLLLPELKQSGKE